MSVSSPGSYLCFWLAGYKSEVPMTPSLSLMNLLEQLTECRKTVFLLDYQFIIKGCNSGRAGGREAEGKAWGEDVECPCPQSSHSPSISICSPTQKHSKHFWVFMETSLHCYDWLNHYPLVLELNLQPLSPFRRMWDWNFQHSNHKVELPGIQHPSTSPLSKSCLINITK